MSIVDAIKNEYLRYKRLAEEAIAQLADDDITATAGEGRNSVAIICRHVAGNLRSRFTDFLSSDGEKPWRNRDEEFAPRSTTRAELLDAWQQGWDVLLAALGGLSDADLARTVVIRGEPLRVHEALHRSLAHTSYHVGQIVYIAKAARGADWQCLSIPRGGVAPVRRSDAADPGRDQPRPGTTDDAGGGDRRPTRSFLGGRVQVVVGDITTQHVDAIVNAATRSLLGGGGVDGAIHRAGGPDILRACREIRRTRFPEGLPTGDAVITTAGQLPARHVIHTVGPVRGSHDPVGEAALLASCYRRALELAVEHGASTIAFPAISTGAFGYPGDEAAAVCSGAIAEYLQDDPRISLVRLVFFSPAEAEVFLRHHRFPS